MMLALANLATVTESHDLIVEDIMKVVLPCKLLNTMLSRLSAFE